MFFKEVLRLRVIPQWFTNEFNAVISHCILLTCTFELLRRRGKS